MQRPSDKDKGSGNVPPGGRAFQRIQQDRKARGLDELPTPGTQGPGPSSDKGAPNEQRPKTPKEK
jgi:hypothetical protein